MTFDDSYRKSRYRYDHLMHAKTIGNTPFVYVGIHLRQPILDQAYRQVVRPMEIAVMIATIKLIEESLNSAKVLPTTDR